MSIISRVLIVLVNLTLSIITGPLGFLGAIIYAAYVAIRYGCGSDRFPGFLWLVGGYLEGVGEGLQKNLRFLKTGNPDEFAVNPKGTRT